MEPFGRPLGRIADPREPGVETVEAGREGALHDLAGDFPGYAVERVGERPGSGAPRTEAAWKPRDEKVLSLGRDDAVRIDSVPDLFHRGAPQIVLQARVPHKGYRPDTRLGT